MMVQPGMSAQVSPQKMASAGKDDQGTEQKKQQPIFNIGMLPPKDPNAFNVLANPSGNRMLDDMERAFKLR